MAAAALLCLALISKVAQVHAEFIEPQLLKVSTPRYHPDLSVFDPNAGHYEYEVSWQGIPAAEVSIDVKREADTLRVVATANTYRGIDIFYKLRYRAEGLLSAFDFYPKKTIIDQRENSRIVNTQITFLDKGRIFSVRSRKGQDPEVYNFDPENFTLDPFSASFVARGSDWKLGETRQFDTFNGKTRYLISLTAEDLVTMRVNGQERKVWVISPKVENLSSPDSKKKLRRAHIYISADKYREILMIKSEVFIGSVSTKLVSFEPYAEPTTMARLGTVLDTGKQDVELEN